MPIVINNKTFLLKWKPEWDDIINIAANRFRGKVRVNWRKAEVEGYLEGLPSHLTTRGISTCYTFLHRKKRNVKRKRDNKERAKQKDNFYKCLMKRWELFKEIPVHFKNGEVVKNVKTWDKKQSRMISNVLKDYIANVIPKRGDT